MDINPQDESSNTIQYQAAFLKFVGNEYFTKYQHVPVDKHERLPSSNLMPSATASGYCQSSFDSYDLSSDYEGYLTPNNVAETTPGRSNHTAPWLTAARPSLNLPPQA